MVGDQRTQVKGDEGGHVEEQTELQNVGEQSLVLSLEPLKKNAIKYYKNVRCGGKT